MLQGNECILVVDDDPVVREMFEKGLSHVGDRCVTAGSADDGVSLGWDIWERRPVCFDL